MVFREEGNWKRESRRYGRYNAVPGRMIPLLREVLPAGRSRQADAGQETISFRGNPLPGYILPGCIIPYHTPLIDDPPDAVEGMDVTPGG